MELDGIPEVIQSALSTNHFQPNAKHELIRGLHPFLLPKYLLLRTGGELPQHLQSAHEEELRCRQRSDRANKRKRRRCRAKRNDVDSNPMDGKVDGFEQNQRKRKWNCASSGTDQRKANGSEAFNYQMLARIVVAPYTPFLIDTMNELQSQSVSSEKDAKNKLPEKEVPLASGNATSKLGTAANMSAVKNIYLKPKNSQLQASKCLAISSPRESLESLVDGVVSNLVQRTYSLRSSYPIKSNTSNVKLIHRRRQRNSKNKQQPQSTLNPSVAKQNNSSVNDWLRSSNILSKGYSLGNSDTYYSTKVNSKVQTHTVRACPNMAPGVHCIQPNSVTTYARTSGLMRLLHSVVGDEILSEILLNCVVLIPTFNEGAGNAMSVFGKGNFFQLCGMPLNLVTKEFGKLNADIYPHWGGKNCKRKRDDVGSTVDVKHDLKPAQWNPNKPLPRSKLFYCDFYAKRIGLSPHHILNQPNDSTKSSPTDIELKLLDAMVQLYPKCRDGSVCEKSNVVVHINKRRKRWTRLRESGIAMCKEIIRRHKKCNYGRLLENNCPLLVDRNNNKNVLDAKEELTHLVTMFTPTDDIGRFLEAVLRTAFPNTFWGSRHNFHQVTKTVNVFINLRISESFPEKLLIEGLRVLDMEWLHPKSQNSSSKHSQKKRKLSRSAHESSVVLLRNVMRWVYCQFIMPLLRSTFYITDTEFTGRRVVYYRKPVWARIRLLSLEILMKRQYRERTVDKARKILSLHNVGCPPAPLRLLPKKTGIRAIAMLSKACQIRDIDANASLTSCSSSDLRAPNKILQPAFQALKYEYKKRHLFGAGALGLTEVLPSYCCFLDALRKKFNGEMPRLYFTSADIEHCYDNIHQEHLYKRVRSVLTEDQYITQNHFILHSKDRNGSTRCRWQKTTCSPANFLDITSSSSCYSQRFYNSIIIDGVNFSVEKKQTIQGLLKDHIFGQMVIGGGRNGQQLLLQRKGIPQGSILSSLFCNAFFGNVEDKMLHDVFEDNSLVIKGSNTSNHRALAVESTSAIHLLVRIVDDFLLISTDYDTSLRFLNGLNRGVPRLGVKVNHDKTRVSYKTDTAKAPVSDEDTSMFSWCGLLIDTKSCEIRLDGDRFSSSLATDNVTVHMAGREGAALSKKMKDFVKPRCRQQLLFSSVVNSPETIRINFYQTFLLCATKTMHYLKSVGGWHVKRTHFIYHVVCDTIHYAHLLISSGCDKSSRDENDDKKPYCMSLKEGLWLGRHAFYTVIGREDGFEKLRSSFHERKNVKVRNRAELKNATEKAQKSWPC